VKARLPWVKRLVWYPETGFSVQQVKEKFGTLRFYSPVTDQIAKYINLAERLTENTCEICGKDGKLHTDGWNYVACEEHSKGSRKGQQ